MVLEEVTLVALPVTDVPNKAPYQNGLCEALSLGYSKAVVSLNHFGGYISL